MFRLPGRSARVCGVWWKAAGRKGVGSARGRMSGNGSKRIVVDGVIEVATPGGGKMVNSVEAEAGVATPAKGLTKPAVDKL